MADKGWDQNLPRGTKAQSSGREPRPEINENEAVIWQEQHLS